MTATRPAPASPSASASSHVDLATRTGVEVRLEGLVRRFGDVLALDDLDLALRPGELVALLGPSGCGKTTALRALAGLERLDAGRVVVGGRDLARVPAHRRDMGMVFQAYSLLPHLDALDNVAFGLRLRGVAAGERRRRAMEALDLVGLSAQADRYASQLSGGQQQRVALARALAIEPQVLLLDEPLSALDAKVRAQLREEIRRIQTEVGTTTLLVTHDQEEALAVADRVGVMRAGRIEQLDAPEAVYRRPATPFVAEFVGQVNRVPCVVAGGTAQLLGTRQPVLGDAADGPGTALVRPEDVLLSPAGSGGTGVPAVVASSSFLGPTSRVTVVLADGASLVVQLPTADAAGLAPGAAVAVGVRAVPVLVRQPADA